MTFARQLINTCTTQRFSEGAADDYGVPALTWTDNIVDEPCRLVYGGGREVVIGAKVVVADYQLFIGDIDITEQDRVVISEVTYEVLMVISRQDGVRGHHRQCLLRTVR